MTNNHLATVIAMRELAGIQPQHRIVDILAGVERLHATTRSWAALDPRTAVIDDLIVQVDAIGRALRELRMKSAKAVTHAA